MVLDSEAQFGPVMLDLESIALDSTEVELLRHPNVGGVILFTRNYESPEQLHEFVHSIRKARENILISVDQEGGRVQRFRKDFVALPALRKIGETYDGNNNLALEHSYMLAQLMASELLEYKIDFSFAPVLDIDYGRSEVIGDRAFHNSVESIVSLSNAYVDGLHHSGMAAIGKHFPGHGYVAADSHTEAPIDERSITDIAEKDMRVFQQLITKLDGIMPAHVIYSMADNLPAGFSRYWLQEILREKLSFSGAIFSDDLNMEGAKMVSNNYSGRAKVAIESGCDIVLICNNRPAAEEIIDELPIGAYTLKQDLYRRLRADNTEKNIKIGSAQWQDAVALASEYA